MSDQPTADPSATDAPATPDTDAKPTETVEFWKTKARDQEKRAKDNASAATRLAAIEDAQKSETEKTAERLAAADAEVASVPSKVAEALRDHLVALHEIDKDDAELFLTGKEPELLLKQVTRLLGRGQEATDKRRKNGNHVPSEGTSPTATAGDELETVRALFGG